MEKKQKFIPKANSVKMLQPKTMTFEKFAKIKYNTPYFFELATGDKKLFYFGTRHSRDANDSIFEQIKQKFKEFSPQIVFVEGHTSLEKKKQQTLNELKKLDNAEVINKFGEPGFALKLAAMAGVDVESPEPSREKEIASLVEQGFTKEEIFAYYGYRVLDQYYRIMKENSSVEEYLKSYLGGFIENSNWSDFDYSLEYLQKIGKQIWGKRGDLHTNDLFRARPSPWKAGPKWTRVNDLAQQSSYFRNTFILQRIIEVLKEKDRLFVLFGASHAYMQEPELRKIFKAENKNS
jgi:hypothetical protein